MFPEVDIFSLGWMYEVILGGIFIVIVIDSIGLFQNIKAGGEDLSEYASLCVKYLKIVLLIIAGAFFLNVAFTYGIEDFMTNVIHIVLGICAILDAVVSFIVKLKFSRRFKKK